MFEHRTLVQRATEAEQRLAEYDAVIAALVLRVEALEAAARAATVKPKAPVPS